MHISRSIVLSAAVAFGLAGGCEVHDRDSAPASAGVGVGVGVQADVAVDAPQGMVVEGPGVVAIDVEPDPAQRVYVYDEGYPPGTYIYDNYYYYGGYRYPHDLFVNNFVQANIRQRRFVNVEENRRQGKQIEQRHRAEFTQNHGVRQNRAPAQKNAEVPGRQPATPERQPATPERRPETVRPEVRTPGNEEGRTNVTPENRTAEERRTNVTPENRTPANETPRANVERPAEKKAPANEERNTNERPAEQKAKPANEQPKSEKEQPRQDDPKRDEGK